MSESGYVLVTRHMLPRPLHPHRRVLNPVVKQGISFFPCHDLRILAREICTSSNQFSKMRDPRVFASRRMKAKQLPKLKLSENDFR